MGWEAITTSAVLDEFTPQEAAAIQRIQGRNSLSNVLTRVVKEIRGYIRAGSYPLDPDAIKIPEDLHTDAIDIVRWRLLISIPTLRALQTADRKEACERAEKKLDKIAAQKFAVEEPVLAGDAAPVSPEGTWGSKNKLIMRTDPTPRPGAQFAPQKNSNSNPQAPADYGDNQ